MNIIFTAPVDFNKELKKKIKKKYNVKFVYKISKSELKKKLYKYNVLVTNPGSVYRYDQNVLKNAKNLKYIITPSTGTDHIDTDYCKLKNIKIKSLLNNRKILNNITASAEFTLFLILYTLRKINVVKKITEDGSWRKKEDLFRGNEIYEKKIGIIGYGRIGKKLAKYLSTLGCKIYIYDPYVKIKSTKLKIVKNLSYIFRYMDIISLNLTLNKKTENIIDHKFIKILKKRQILVNTSRGKIVDEKYLIKKIKDKKFHYSTDVISNEFQSNLKKNILNKLSKVNDNLIIMPHVAGLTHESQSKALLFILNELNKI